MTRYGSSPTWKRSLSTEQLDALASAARWAERLDARYQIPGTPIRFGWDALLGLVPGVGDVATLGLSLAPVYFAWRAGAPAHLLRRMVGNVALDSLLGATPIAGDLADVFFRANRRNANLLRNAAQNGLLRERRPAGWARWIPAGR